MVPGYSYFTRRISWSQDILRVSHGRGGEREREKERERRENTSFRASYFEAKEVPVLWLL